ncbi:MAG: V-type ATP synthase subunit A [Planctomycetota bacterium]
MTVQGTISKVSGPLVVGKNLAGVKMFEVVRVGEAKLFGEVIEIRGDRASIQVYEETEGLAPGEPIVPTGEPLSVELGPGLIGSIYDGMQRPLDVLMRDFGDYIVRGAERPALDHAKRWAFKPILKAGDKVAPGAVIGTVPESPLVTHRIMIPANIEGALTEIHEGEFTIDDVVAKVQTASGVVDIAMAHKCPVRIARPVAEKLPPGIPLVTGQRVIDMLFPLLKGGTACVPGPFGSGKTVVQHQLAKWADADIIVYIGCGERGNEMTDVLLEFPELKDPRSGRPLMERTVLVANTSNMPVAAREASVFTGITMAEYYRDMGYHVALMADSTSRWAEAMREMSGRLEEMPGEEGYPAYLASRIASFYERSGSVICMGGEKREGSLSLIGAVSPPGGDLSDPVVQSTLRVVKVFWGLDDRLAAQRHFPAINWLTSYSLYRDAAGSYADEHVDKTWGRNRIATASLLQREAELEELVRIVGMESLSDADKILLEGAKMIREDFLHQNAFHEEDTYTSLSKQHLILSTILLFYRDAEAAIAKGARLSDIIALPLRDEIARIKYIPEKETSRIKDLQSKIQQAIADLSGKKES